MGGIHDMLAIAQQQAAASVFASFPIKRGEVVSFDADNYTVVVRLLPYGVNTGDIPLYTPWAGTPGTKSGLRGGPAAGTTVLVLALDPGGAELVAMATSYSGKNEGPATAEGEYHVAINPETYVKMDLEENTKIGGGATVQAIAPRVELKSSSGALADGDGIVRKEDLQAVVDSVNALVDWLNTCPFLGNFGAPVLPRGIPRTHIADATASSIAGAEE